MTPHQIRFNLLLVCPGGLGVLVGKGGALVNVKLGDEDALDMCSGHGEEQGMTG
jgi:hypothetical protein